MAKAVKKQVKQAVKEAEPEPKESNEIPVASSSGESEPESDSDSEVELSEDSASEDEEDEEAIKGFEDKPQHVIIKPSKKIDTSKSKGKKGVIYLGRIPDGFYEEEMKKYFSQFGDISRVKLSRNKKTGKSKHYGFVEFDNIGVAKVASEAMNNYLLYGHLLKCYVVENPSDLIFSQNKFRIIPWKSISKHRNDKPKTQEHWDKLSKKFDSAKDHRKKHLQLKGIDVSYLD